MPINCTRSLLSSIGTHTPVRASPSPRVSLSQTQTLVSTTSESLLAIVWKAFGAKDVFHRFSPQCLSLLILSLASEMRRFAVISQSCVKVRDDLHKFEDVEIGKLEVGRVGRDHSDNISSFGLISDCADVGGDVRIEGNQTEPTMPDTRHGAGMAGTGEKRSGGRAEF